MFVYPYIHRYFLETGPSWLTKTLYKARNISGSHTQPTNESTIRHAFLREQTATMPYPSLVDVHCLSHLTPCSQYVSRGHSVTDEGNQINFHSG